MEFEQIFNDFRNEIFCRHESNQHKAEKIWIILKTYFTEDVARNFKTDWYHYTHNSLDYDGLALALKELKITNKIK